MKFFNIILFTLAFCLTLSGCADGNATDTDDTSDASDTVDTTADISPDSETEETEDMTDTDETDTTDTDAPETDETDPVAELSDLMSEVDGIIEVRKDGTVLIESNHSEFAQDEYDVSNDVLYKISRSDTISKLRDASSTGELSLCVEIGDAKIDFSSHRKDGNDGEWTAFEVESVEVYGQKVVPVYSGLWGERPFSLNAAFLRTFWIDGLFVFSNMGYSYVSTTYIFYDGGYTVAPSIIENGTNSYVHYALRDGVLTYQRTTEKYYPGGVSYLEMLVARDEFFREYGTVELVNGEAILTPTEKKTFDETHDLEAEWENWREALEGKYLEMTLDEYLAENAEKYERAE